MKGNGYVGKISHSGAQKIEAPNSKAEKGKSTVKKGGDLRTGK